MRDYRYNRYIGLLALLFFVIDLTVGANNYKGRIDRRGVVRRNNPHITRVDTMSSLSVGNGHFAFTVDITGLQTFPEYYSNGMPLGTMSDWGWHSFPNDSCYAVSESWIEKDFGRGHKELYSAEFRSMGRQHDASTYFRQNPHRLHLGVIGLKLKDPSMISDAEQSLDMWSGLIDSRFKYDNRPYHVQTVCSGERDKIGCKVMSKGDIEIEFRVPYPTGKHSDDGCDWSVDGRQEISMQKGKNNAVLTIDIDATRYYVRFNWKGKAVAYMSGRHQVILRGKDILDFTAEFIHGKSIDGRGVSIENRRQSQLFSSAEAYDSERFDDVLIQSKKHWQEYWENGGIADFSHVSDPRGKELERRVVLSQYLLAVNEGGDTPPQETGLTYNSWFGKFHLEMIWWHEAQFALWGHPELLERSLDWYFSSAEMGREIAKRQGFDGLRWMKMTDPNGVEAPSNVGSYLIWQQPHIIYLAELLYLSEKDESGRRRITEKYKGLIEESARFMYSFASYDSVQGRYILKGCIPAQETLKADSTVNPPFELNYWYWGLKTAQQWRERSGLSRESRWDDCLSKLSELSYNSDSLYLAAESATDTYIDIRYTSDHPSVLGAIGVLPSSRLTDDDIMRKTLEWVMQNWNWDKTWGWDYPMVAMCAARLGMKDTAVDALLMNCRTNTYLVNGHNYQDSRLRVYLPGNGGLLTAVGMMLAGWDGSEGEEPGFPDDWDVRYEGIRRMP